jgi:hypothetical protein
MNWSIERETVSGKLSRISIPRMWRINRRNGADSVLIDPAQELKRNVRVLVVKLRGESLSLFVADGWPSRIFWRMGLLAVSSLLSAPPTADTAQC